MQKPFSPIIPLVLFLLLNTAICCSSGSYFSQSLSSCQTCANAITDCEICEVPTICQACPPTQVFKPRIMILTASKDYDIRLTDFETKAGLLQITQPSDVVNVARFSPLGNLLAAGDNSNYLWLFEPFTKTTIYKWATFRDGVVDITFSPDQKIVVASGDINDETTQLFDLSSKNSIGTITNPHGPYPKIAECLDYHPQNHEFSSVGNDNTVRIWNDSPPFANFKSFPLNGGGECVRYNSDGTKLAGSTDGADSSMYIWDLVEDSICALRTTKQNDKVSKFEWSPDNTIIAAASPADAKIWSTSDGSLVSSLTYDSGDGILGLKFLPDGTLFAGAGVRKKIYFWDKTGAQNSSLTITTSHALDILDVDVFPTKSCFQYTKDCPICSTTPKCTSCKLGWKVISHEIISGSTDGNIKVWDEFSKPLLTLSSTHLGGVTALSSSPDFTKFASGGYDFCDIYIKLSAFPSGNIIWEIQHAHTNKINSIAFSPDGNWIASASTDKTIKIWNVQTRCLTMVFFENTGGILQSNFYKTGEKLISFSLNSKVAFWDLTTGKKIIERTMPSSIVCADLSPDNSLVVIVDTNNYINMIGSETWTINYSLLVSSDPVLIIRFSPDGSNFATGHSNNKVIIWETATGSQLHTFVGHTGPVITLKYLSNGRKLLSGSQDETLKIWDIQNKILLETLSGHSGAVFLSDVRDTTRCEEIIVDNCDIFGDLKMKCTKCKADYFLFDKNTEGFFSECVYKDSQISQVYKSSSTLDGSGIMNYCLQGYTGIHALNNIGYCVLCSELIDQCSECISDNVCIDLRCTRCNTNYYLFDRDSQGFYSDCVHKDSLTIQVFISKPGLDGTGVVKNCADDDTKVLDDNGACVSCTSLIPNCSKCSSKTDCHLCTSGFYTKDNQCIKCHKQCLSCSSFRKCTTCPNRIF